MFVLELVNTATVYINGFRIVDLQKPFHRIVGNHGESINKILRTPSESLSRQKKPLTYYVKFSERRAGALFNSEVHGLKSHWVYNTNTHISPLFRDKALSTLVNLLETIDTETYNEVRRYLSSILMLLWKSFSFDCVFSSLQTLPVLVPNIPIIVAPLTLVALPEHVAHNNVRHKTLQAVLKGHSGGIPLSILTGASYNFLSLRHTTFDRSLIKDKKSILVIEGTNTAYAGFLARELSFFPEVHDVLPVCLFHINR